jgi:nucleoside-diphosphate-sugar epimerase
MEHFKDHTDRGYHRDYVLYGYKRGNLLAELSMFNPDVIINCAAEIYDTDCMFRSNVILTKDCLEWVTNNPKTRMIQIGSSSEYGPLSHAGSETDRINPIDMYQATKGMATILCQGFARTHGLDIAIARPYSVYGRYEKPHRLFPRLWKAFMLDQPMELFDGQHDFIYIDDFVRGISTLIYENGIPSGDIVNFGSGVQYGNFEILDLFETITGKTAPVTKIDKMAKKFETLVWKCNTDYARERYGFTCHFGIEDGIRDFIKTASYSSETS